MLAGWLLVIHYVHGDKLVGRLKDKEILAG